MSDQPVEKLRIGSVTATIWCNTSDKGRTYYTITILRAYRTKDGWKDTASFRPRDLPVITQLTDLASRRIIELQAASETEAAA